MSVRLGACCQQCVGSSADVDTNLHFPPTNYNFVVANFVV